MEILEAKVEAAQDTSQAIDMDLNGIIRSCEVEQADLEQAAQMVDMQGPE